MSESLAKYLDTFAGWLRTLGEDAEKLGVLLEGDGVSQQARESIAGGLNYLFKSLDLIPDGIDDIGYLDDAFVPRVAADLAVSGDGEIAPARLAVLTPLANDCDPLREFLGKDYVRLEAYVKGLRKGAARGRSVGDILSDDGVRADFVSDVRGFAKTYETPGFSREEKNLIKLKAFFDAKLPK
jgi:uncharacterized membrane protein YkvA (DUF1232 family)